MHENGICFTPVKDKLVCRKSWVSWALITSEKAHHHIYQEILQANAFETSKFAKKSATQ